MTATPGDTAAGETRPDAVAARTRDNLIGGAWMVVSALSATVMLVAVRMLSDAARVAALSPEMLAFLRMSLGLWIALLFLADGRLWRFRFSRPGVHLLRGVLIAAALTLAFVGVARLPLATASILLFLAPVFAAGLAGPVLGETVGRARWLAVGAGFLGAAIIVRPGFAALSPDAALGAASAIAAALLFSVGLLLTKHVRQDGADAVLLAGTTIGALTTLPLALVNWSPPPTSAAWAWAGVLALSSSLRMYADIKAYSRGDAGFVAPFAYLRLVFAAAFGWALFGETLDGWTLVGAAVIVAAAGLATANARGGASAAP